MSNAREVLSKVGEIALEEIRTRVDLAQAKNEKGSNLLIVPGIVSLSNGKHGAYMDGKINFQKQLKQWLQDTYSSYKKGEELGFIYTDVKPKNSIPLQDEDGKIRFPMIDFDVLRVNDFFQSIRFHQKWGILGNLKVFHIMCTESMS